MTPERLATIRNRTTNKTERWNVLFAQQDIRDLLEYVDELETRVDDLIGTKIKGEGLTASL